jgi:hypothetical protein
MTSVRVSSVIITDHDIAQDKRGKNYVRYKVKAELESPVARFHMSNAKEINEPPVDDELDFTTLRGINNIKSAVAMLNAEELEWPHDEIHCYDASGDVWYSITAAMTSLYTSWHRYSDFRLLQKKLNAQFVGLYTGKIDGKRMTGHLSSSQTKKRRVNLNEFLQTIIAQPKLARSHIMLAFLAILCDPAEDSERPQKSRQAPARIKQQSSTSFSESGALIGAVRESSPDSSPASSPSLQPQTPSQTQAGRVPRMVISTTTTREWGGWLKKISRFRRIWKDRYFKLTGSELIELRHPGSWWSSGMPLGKIVSVCALDGTHDRAIFICILREKPPTSSMTADSALSAAVSMLIMAFPDSTSRQMQQGFFDQLANRRVPVATVCAQDWIVVAASNNAAAFNRHNRAIASNLGMNEGGGRLLVVFVSSGQIVCFEDTDGGYWGHLQCSAITKVSLHKGAKDDAGNDAGPALLLQVRTEQWHGGGGGDVVTLCFDTMEMLMRWELLLQVGGTSTILQYTISTLMIMLLQVGSASTILHVLYLH